MNAVFLREQRENAFWQRVWFVVLVVAAVFVQAGLIGGAMLLARDWTLEEVKAEAQREAAKPKPGFSCKQILEAFRICVDHKK